MLNLFKKKKETKQDFWSAMAELDKLGQQAAKATANEVMEKHYKKEVNIDIALSRTNKAV